MFKSLSNSQLMVMFLGSKKLMKTRSKTDLVRLMVGLSTELVNRNFTHFNGWHDFSQWESFSKVAMHPYKNQSLSSSFSQN